MAESDQGHDFATITRLISLPDKQKLRESDVRNYLIVVHQIQEPTKDQIKAQTEALETCYASIRQSFVEEVRATMVEHALELGLDINSYEDLTRLMTGSRPLTIDVLRKIFEATTTIFYKDDLKHTLAKIGRGILDKKKIEHEGLTDDDFNVFFRDHFSGCRSFVKKDRGQQKIGLTMRKHQNHVVPPTKSEKDELNFVFTYQNIQNFEALAEYDPEAQRILQERGVSFTAPAAGIIKPEPSAEASSQCRSSVAPGPVIPSSQAPSLSGVISCTAAGVPKNIVDQNTDDSPCTEVSLLNSTESDHVRMCGFVSYFVIFSAEALKPPSPPAAGSLCHQD